jgi:phosphoserine phosphatase RsbU/P
VQAKSRSMLVAVLVTSAIALLDAWTGGHAILVGLLIAGPLLAAASLDAQRTAIVGLYALGLAVLLGIPDGIFGTTDHLLRCLGVATGGALGVFIAHRRAEQEQALVRITRIAEVAQRTILRPVPPRMGRVALAVRYLSASKDALVGGDFYDLAVTRHGLRVLVGDVKGKGLEAVQLAALVLASFRTSATHPSLVELAAELDRSVRPQLGEEDFVTAVLAQFGRRGELQLVNCGHPPPLRVRAGTAEWLASAAPTTPLGLDPAPTVQRFALGPHRPVAAVHRRFGGGAGARRAAVRAGRPGGGRAGRVVVGRRARSAGWPAAGPCGGPLGRRPGTGAGAASPAAGQDRLSTWRLRAAGGR